MTLPTLPTLPTLASGTLRIAARNVVRNRRRSLFTLLAMFLALSVMVMVRGMLNAMNASVRDNLVAGQLGALQVHRSGYLKAITAGPLDLDVPADAAFLARLRALPHVVAVAPRIPFAGTVHAHDRSGFALFFAVDPVEEAKVCPQRFSSLVSGRALGPGAPAGALLTPQLLARVGAAQGEHVDLLGADRDGVLNAVEVEVTGTVADAGVMVAEKKVLYLPLAVATELLRMPGRATELAIAVDEYAHVDAVAASLRAALGPDYQVSTWHDLIRFVDDTMEKQDIAVSWVANTFLLVALLGIANTMLISVRQRTREIGTMMAVGMRRRQILGLFLVEAAILGLSGGALGIAAAGALVHHFGAVGIQMRVTGGTSVFELRPYLTTGWVIGTFLIAALGITLAALYPALRASRLRPIEALSQPA